jgi:hypothetical protein
MADEPLSKVHRDSRGRAEGKACLPCELVGNGIIAEIGPDLLDEGPIIRAGVYRDQEETVVPFPADDECARHVLS